MKEVVHTHGCMNTYICPYKDLRQCKTKPCGTQLPIEPALGCLCTTQTLEPCAGKSSWGRASNPQEDCPGLMESSRNLKFHNDLNTAKQDKDSSAFTSPVNTDIPIGVTAQLGWLLP